jgi:hypothetical protein
VAQIPAATEPLQRVRSKKRVARISDFCHSFQQILAALSIQKLIFSCASVDSTPTPVRITNIDSLMKMDQLNTSTKKTDTTQNQY